MGTQYDTAHSTCTIAIQPEQMQLQKLTAHDGTYTHRVHPMMQTMIHGVEFPKKGIGSRHCQVPDTPHNDVGSKNS